MVTRKKEKREVEEEDKDTGGEKSTYILKEEKE